MALLQYRHGLSGCRDSDYKNKPVLRLSIWDFLYCWNNSWHSAGQLVCIHVHIFHPILPRISNEISISKCTNIFIFISQSPNTSCSSRFPSSTSPSPPHHVHPFPLQPSGNVRSKATGVMVFWWQDTGLREWLDQSIDLDLDMGPKATAWNTFFLIKIIIE